MSVYRQFYINCSLLGIIDESGTLTMHALLAGNDNDEDTARKDGDQYRMIEEFVRKDVWDIKFADVSLLKHVY